MTENNDNDRVTEWLAALEARHLAELTFPEVRRAAQALSSLYVQRRGRLSRALDGAGKRAAFALYYGPLHFLLIREIVSGLRIAGASVDQIMDLGCGTGVAGAAWALARGGTPRVIGVERNDWASREARATFAMLQLSGRVQRKDVSTARLPGAGSGIVAAFLVNELKPEARELLLKRLLAAATNGARVLIVEPIASRPISWWSEWASAFADAGGRDDRWTFQMELPELLERFDQATGLSHEQLKGRSLYLG